MEEIRHMDLESEDLIADRVGRLKELFPEIATEGDGSIDFEKLRLILGEEVDEGDERYAFTWPGKADAIRQAQTISTATLRPCPEKSVDWDTTQNLYIEGDNLEVLKLLQRGYHGKVKMIYIDPPYNTGGDFIYSDSFADSLQAYKQQTGLQNQSNAETSGRYHSAWCSMMYPRIKLARELLKPEGVMAISIDDHELPALIQICREIFGENNFEGHIHWRRRHNQPNDKTKMLGLVAEHIIVFAKDSVALRSAGVGKLDSTATFTNPDNDPRGPWASKPWKVGSDQSGSHYVIKTPGGEEYDEAWMGEESTYQRYLSEGRIYFPKNGHGLPRKKYYQSEREEEGQCATNWWPHDQFGHNQAGNDRLTSLFGVKNIFSNPKPIELIQALIKVANVKSGDIVLDFFAGSSSTADALLNLNFADSVNRHFVMIQLPQTISEKETAYAAGYRQISELGEERIRRAGRKIAEEVEESNRQLKIGEEPKKIPDIGFRVLRLDDSGIARPEPGQLMLDRVKPDRTDEDIVFEMMLKWGIELTYPIEKVEIGGYLCCSVAGDALICCMQKGLTVGAIQAIADRLPSRVLMLDSILDDTLKLNAVQIFKHAEEKHQVTIDLRTV